MRAGQRSAANYDDVIKGKGKRIIFLQHGPPGVGQTFTAGRLPSRKDIATVVLINNKESIAETIQRPLYTMSSPDLVTFLPYVEEQLSTALALATKWNAVVLIDEADVFMAERNLVDLQRNALVSGKAF